MGIAYCGIDIGLKTHSVCLLDEQQNTVKKYTIQNDREGFERLRNDIERTTRICLEPTGVYSINFFLYFKDQGYDIKFCKTESSHNFRQSMFRSKKHDRLDAFALAKYRIVHEHQTTDGMKLLEKLGNNTDSSSPDFQALSELLDQYYILKKRTEILQKWIKNIVDLRFPEAIQIFTQDRGGKTIREALIHSKEDILAGKVKLKRLADIQDKLKDSIGQYELKRSDFIKYDAELDALEERIQQLERQIKEKLTAMGYASLFQYRALKAISIARFITEIRDIRKFYRYSDNGCLNKKRSLKAFKKFLGIAVSSNQSGMKEGGHKLTRAGNVKLRGLLFMMAMNYTQVDLTKAQEETADLNPVKSKILYEKHVAKGTKKLIALSKVMNKITTDLFFILKKHADSQIIAVQA